MNNLITENIREAMIIEPEYDLEIINGTKEQRLLALLTIYKVFYPLKSNAESVYTSLYLSCRQAIERKQNNEMLGINSSMSYAMLGSAGVGKTSLVHRSIDLIDNSLIEISTDEINYKIIPYLVIETPINSVKSLLYLIAEMVDERLGTSYSKQATSRKMTLDQLMNLVINHICKHCVGVLILDEIQNVLAYRYLATESIINCLVNISNSGTTVILVGMNEIESFFSERSHLARRSMPITVEPFSFDTEFENLLIRLFNYRYSNIDFSLNYSTSKWFFDHTNGVPGILQELWYRANLLSINKDVPISMELLKESFFTMKTIHPYIVESEPTKPNSRCRQNNQHIKPTVTQDGFEDFDLVSMINRYKADKEHLDLWTMIQEKVRVVRI